MIDTDFWKDDKLSELDFTTRLVFISTWTYADDKGYYEENYKKMRAVMFPYDVKLDIQKHIEKLIGMGFIAIYEKDGVRYHHVKNFKKFQTINRPTPSKIDILVEDSIQLTDNSLNPVCKVKLSEVKLSEVKLSKVKLNKKKEHPRLFSFLYEQYPNKEGKATAFKYFNQYIRTKKDWFAIYKALKNYKDMLAIDTWRKPQLASVWFNTPEKGKKGGDKGWVNFVDYVHPEKQKELQKQKELMAAQDKYNKFKESRQVV